MKTKSLFTRALLPIVILVHLSASQNSVAAVVVHDDFDDGVLDPSWTIDFELADGWIFEESGTLLTVTDIANTIVNNVNSDLWSEVKLTQEFPPLSDFNVDFAVSWDSLGSLRAMQRVMVGLYSDDGTLVAEAGYSDSWVGHRGHIRAQACIDSFLSGSDTLPYAGSASILIQRAADTIDVAWNGNSLLNVDCPIPVARVEVSFEYFAYSGQGGTSFFGSEAVDLITVEGGPPEIITALSAIRLGEPFSLQFQAAAVEPPLLWAVADGALPPGMDLSEDGVFSGTPTELGESTFAVRVTDTNTEFAQKEFAIDVVLVLPPPDIRIHKTGTTTVPGRDIEYFILVENVGNVIAENIEVGEPLNPRQVSLLAVDPPAVAELPTLRDASFILWIIPELAPREAVILTYQVRLSPTVPIGATVLGGPGCTGEGQADSWEYCLEETFLTSAGCALCAAECTTLVSTCGFLCTIPSPPTIIGCLLCIAPCADCLLIGAQTGGDGGCVQDVGDVINCYRDMHENCYQDEQTATAPVDPNEKLIIAKKCSRSPDGTITCYIQPEQLLVYPIHFENIGDVEAIDVFVTDVLDANLDDSTLVLLTPGGAYDSVARAVSWDLLGTNLQPGETGNVLFSIKPEPGLPSGTEIHNDAEIQFEIFDPLTTPDVVTIIDTTPPSCVMDPLPVETSTLDFAISWSGTDAIGEIESYSVFVSVDGGVFAPFRNETTDTNATFSGELGKTYSFFCVSVDTAGNAEVQGPVAEAMTTIILDNDGDGVPDATDECPVSDLSPTVVIDDCDSGVGNLLFEDGCTMADTIAECAVDVSNHGEFVSCVAQLTNTWKQEGLISGQDKGRIQSCAAQAEIGQSCATDTQCDDGLFCNGVEVCLEGECVTGDPCPGQGCDEVADQCVD